MLFYNPKSGGGKAERFKLADEARARGIEPIELGPPWDLEALVRGAIERGADGLAMAGGDGSQAIVAGIAAERQLPYACIPAGTRNHFALDLGVDRDDVVGALDAFVDGGERIVDLAEVNGRVFVNNVSLGVYAESVPKSSSTATRRSARSSTPCRTCSVRASALDLRWTGPGGQTHHSGAMVLVSNNQYRLGRAVGSGTRPRIDDGLLGVTVVGGPKGGGEGGRRLQRPAAGEFSAQTFEVNASHRRRHRRRGAASRPALDLRDPAGGPARADRAATPGRVSLGADPRGPARGPCRADPESRWAAQRPATPKPNTPQRV